MEKLNAPLFETFEIQLATPALEIIQCNNSLPGVAFF